MATLLPIRFAEVLNLSKMGVDPNHIKFKNVAMQSDKFVTIIEEGQDSVSIVDTVTKCVQKFPAKIDHAIMNPLSKVVGFRAQGNLQIYNLEMQTRMKATVLQDTVAFWKWIDQKTIAIVTGDSVLHWSMDGDAAPTKVFGRSPYDGQVQILNYQASNDQNWLLLSGIAMGKTGGVEGVLQLYSVERKVSQPTINATTGTFATIKLDGREEPSLIFCFIGSTPAGTKLSVIELGASKENSFKLTADVKFATEQDFAVSMLADDKHGTLFVSTKAGYLYLYEIQSGRCYFDKRVSQATMFASVTHQETGGIVSIDQTGRLILIAVDEANCVPYITGTLRDLELGVRMAARYNLPGADNVFKQQFEKLIAAGQVAAAAKIASESPQGVLRTPETIAAFKRLPVQQGQPAPVLQYFSLLLQKNKLNAVESIELARPVLASGAPAGKKHLQDWITQGKLEFSEELGDMLRSSDVKLACSVYLRANCAEKAIGCFLQLGEFDKIIAYARSVNFTPDYPLLLQQLHRINREYASKFALMLFNNEGGSLIDVNIVVDLFMQANDAKSTTEFLLDVLQKRGDRPEDAHLQTKLLEINLMHSPQVADAILDSQQYKFSHFDKNRIAQMCERAHLFNRAISFYQNIDDVKRVLMMGLNANLIKPEFVIEFFGRQTPDDAISILRDLLKYNMQAHIRLVVEVAKAFNEQLGTNKLIEMFEEFDAWNGLYYYLGAFVNVSEDPEIVFKYIVSGARLNQVKEVERVCRDHNHYDPLRVKEYLLELNLKDPRPLIHVCDRFDFVEELTRYLYTNNMFPFIQAYVEKMNQAAAPKVIGSLIDQSCDEAQIRGIFQTLRADLVPITELSDELEKRNRLRMLLPWLEQRRHEGSEDVGLHNALGKIYVETNNNPTYFLTNNPFYDSKVVGKYCESRDPHLAFLAYKRAKGSCDDELLEVSNRHGFFRDQSKYLVERQDETLWAKALSVDNDHRRSLIDQVVATALPESRVPEEVSATVKAFMAADLPNELIELLERIVLHGPSDSEFHNNRNLQNLLILTAIKADPQRVGDYLNRLDNYDGPEIARIAVSDQYMLYEEAFFIYKKFKKGEEAIKVLLDHIQSIERAVEFAEYWDMPDVWSLLANAQLTDGQTAAAIASFLKAEDPAEFERVIDAANRDSLFAELIGYLKMARTKLREVAIDNELLYAHAKTGNLVNLEDFLHAPNIAKVEPVGDRVFDEGLYEAARILFQHVGNYAKLALCFVHLEQYQAAVDAARKANSIPTWKAVCYACVDAHEFRLAQACGVHIIVFMDHLNDLIHHYEVGGHFDQVIALLEQGINLDRAHQGIYTQLGILYARYKEEKLMEHIKLFWSRLNIPTLLGACRENLHWTEVVFLYSNYDQYDNAVDVLIEHSSSCWTHDLFKQTVVQVTNTEVFYRAIAFYVKEHPLLLNDLLIEMSPKLDHTRVTNLARREGHLPLSQKYLLFVQRDNIVAVNEAINELYVEQENHAGLRESIELYGHFDQISLAQKIDKHELLEFRRIAASLYKDAKRFKISMELSKKDDLWQDVISTAACSQDRELVEDLLRYFVQRKESPCFAAALFACYKYVRADVVLELAWRNNLSHYAMPFMIQTFRAFDDRIQVLQARFAAQDQAKLEAEQAEKKKVEEASEQAAQYVGAPILGPNVPLALPAPPIYGGGGYGGGYGGIGMTTALVPFGMTPPNPGYGF